MACTACACDQGSTAVDANVCDGALGCGSCGERGNELGVGRYCTQNGDECLDTDAVLCTIWFEPSAPPFCTLGCKRDTDCGTNAYCGSNPDKPSQRGCTPYVCGRPPDAGLADATLVDATL